MDTFTYLPYVRQGLISAATSTDLVGGRIQLKVKTEISNGAGDTIQTKDVTIVLFGPGDVLGINTDAVIRGTPNPPDQRPDFEPNYFPFIEFDQPDFPWLFTPQVPENNRLQPWICLIVVEKRDGVDLMGPTGENNKPLPGVLSITTDAFKELPDLSEAWAWAHVQVSTTTGTEDDIKKVIGQQHGPRLSRLMCPRHLEEKKSYYACLVPTFKYGVQSGLGDPIDASMVQDRAWVLTVNSPNEIRLPVYYSWEFATGAQGDFEALVWQLEPRQLTFNEVGTRKLDISQAGYGLPENDPPVDLEGALAPLQDPPRDVSPGGPSATYQTKLQDLLNETATPPPDVPVLPPPLYGRWHAAQRAIPDTLKSGTKRDRPWLRAINLDPCYRVAAGLGAEIVRDQQEQLMTSAWEQVGDIERANQIVRQAQLACAASKSIHEERLKKLDEKTFLLMMGPVLPRVSYANSPWQNLTALGRVMASALPRAVTSAQFRRMVRPRGRIAQRFNVAGKENLGKLITNLNNRTIKPAPLTWPTPNGMMTMESIIDRSPCAISPEKLLTALDARWGAEQLLKKIGAILDIFNNGRKSISSLSSTAQSQLGQAEIKLVKAQEMLNKFMSVGASYSYDSVVTYYQPALYLIEESKEIINNVDKTYQTPLRRLLSWMISVIWVISKILKWTPLIPQTFLDQLAEANAALPDHEQFRIILFGLAAIMLQHSVEPCEYEPVQIKPQLDFDEFKTIVHNQLEPRKTISARISKLIEAPGWQAEELDFVLVAPDFPTPMYKALADQSQEWLLPGLEHIPPNTITSLESNPRFIEAFLVGLNHEMSRELLWRGYPTDQRGTYFRQFWDPSGRFPGTNNEVERKANIEDGKDISPIHEWAENNLGKNIRNPEPVDSTGPPTQTQMVLLIRGDLLRRYPGATIFAAKAEWTKDAATNKKTNPRNPTSEEEYPIFRGELSPDIYFLGFNLDPVTARGTDDPSSNTADDGAGWFIIIQQEFQSPHYGLDDTEAQSLNTNWTWRDLAWPHVNLSEGSRYIKLAGGLKPVPEFPGEAQKKPHAWKWDSTTDSAQIACITLQSSVRVAIHASDLLPETRE